MKTFLVQYYNIHEQKTSDIWIQIEAPNKDAAELIALKRAYKRPGITAKEILELGKRKAP